MYTNGFRDRKLSSIHSTVAFVNDLGQEDRIIPQLQNLVFKWSPDFSIAKKKIPKKPWQKQGSFNCASQNLDSGTKPYFFHSFFF